MYVTRSAHLQSLTLTRKLSSGHLAPGRPAVLALMRRRRRQRRRSGVGRVDLLTLSSQRLCIRRETPTDARDHTQSHTTTRTPRHPPPRPTGQWLQFAVNQIGRAVCGLRFDNPEQIIADLGPTFRDLSIGTLALCALFDCLGAA